MAEVLLGLIRGDQEGNWSLHLAHIQKVIPLVFCNGQDKLSIYLPVYYNQMSHLQETSPNLSHFESGGFSVQLRPTHPFGRIPIDQILRETVSKDNQRWWYERVWSE